MNKRERMFLALLTLISIHGLLIFNNACAQPAVELETEIDTQVICIGGRNPQEVTITAKITGQNLHFEWDIDGPGTLRETATNRIRVYIPPDIIDGETAQATIIVITINDTGEKAIDKLTFTLIALLPEELLNILKINYLCDKYERLIEQEQQGVTINDQIVPVLQEIIKGYKEAEEMYHNKLSQEYPKISQEEVTRIQNIRGKFEQEYADRLYEFRISRIVITNIQNEIIEPEQGIYSITAGEPITIRVIFTNPNNHHIDVKWTAGRGKISSDSRIITFYTAENHYMAKEPGIDHVKVFLLDTRTGTDLQKPISIKVIPQ